MRIMLIATLALCLVLALATSVGAIGLAEELDVSPPGEALEAPVLDADPVPAADDGSMGLGIDRH